ncbi:unnamed protein product [Ilex paraguariensis]|uniref:AIPP2-like SPOC-like domain-containing protein n=1 Tax=Ilex paraguariensis TaxID=185542 RepID=A0ABC8RSL6_9AQUA
MPDPMDEAHKDEKCDVCGDIGVVDAIATCSLCKINCEHCYCMRTYYEHAPSGWHCEACTLNNMRISPPSDIKGDLPMASLSKSSKAGYGNAFSAGLDKLSNDSSKGCIDWEKKVEKGKVKYLPVELAIMLSSGAKKCEYPEKNKRCSSPGSSKMMTSMLGMASMKLKAIPPKLLSPKIRANPSFAPSGFLRHPGCVNFQTNSMVQPQVMQSPKQLEGKDAVVAHSKAHIYKNQPVDTLNPAEEIETINTRVHNSMSKASLTSSPSRNCPPFLISGDDGVCTKVDRRTSESPNGNLMNIHSKVEKFLPSDPALDASWKGRFKLTDNLKQGELSDGIQAHPPSRVRCKVYEFSKKMPEVLQFELVPRINLWTDLFQDDCPDKEDIGLYFFPSGRYESYISLLEFLGHQDLVMRNIMNDVELFVLTSRLLDMDSQRWNGKYFLWGVFHHVKKDDAVGMDNMKFTFLVHPSNGVHGSHVEGDESDDSQVIDMEIDMLGGENVGPVDIAISQKSLKRGSEHHKEEPATPITSDSTLQRATLDVGMESCSDIPPGFESVWQRVGITS